MLYCLKMKFLKKTEGRQGFFHVLDMQGTVDQASLTYIIRDHDHQKFEQRKQLMQDITAKLNKKLGQERVVLELKDQYYNMREVIEKDMTVVELAKQAMENLGITSEIYPVRGGQMVQRSHLWAYQHLIFFAGARICTPAMNTFLSKLWKKQLT